MLQHTLMQINVSSVAALCLEGAKPFCWQEIIISATGSSCQFFSKKPLRSITYFYIFLCCLVIVCDVAVMQPRNKLI